MEPGNPPEVDALFAHAGFVRGLARGLLGRDGRVEDVVQDTWVVALEKGPGRAGALRGWLAKVVRNLAFTIRRRDSSRHHREERAARSVDLPSTAEIAEREETRRRVLRAVLDLAEPYRSVLLYRYYEDMPPREIARALDVPVETVRTRVKRGLAQLRLRLDDEHAGDRRAWCLALLPLAGLSPKVLVPAAAAGTGAKAISGVLLMTTKTKLLLLTAVALLLFVGVAIKQFGDDGSIAPPDRKDPTGWSATAADRELDPPIRTVQGDPDAPPVASGGESPTLPDDPPEEGRVAFGPPPGSHPGDVGQVAGNVAAEGSEQPVAGAKVKLVFDYARSEGKWPKEGVKERTTESDPNGNFDFGDLDPGVYRITIEHSDYAPRTLTGVRIDETAGLAGIPVVLARSMHMVGAVEGLVLDRYGAPRIGVRVVAHSSMHGGRVEAVTDGDGFYRMERLLPGHYSISLTKPQEDGKPGNLWLRTRHATAVVGETARIDFEGSGALTGIALDADGNPLAGAQLLLSPTDYKGGNAQDRRGKTEQDGTFRIENAGFGSYRVYVGGVGDLYFSTQVAILTLADYDQEVRLQLEEGEISGTLLLEDGKPPRSKGLFPGMILYHLEEGKQGRFQVAYSVPDHLGRYVFRGLPAKNYRLIVYLKGYEQTESDLEIGWGEKLTKQDLTLKRLRVGTLKVLARDTLGKPVEGLMISYSTPSGKHRTVQSDSPAPGEYVGKVEAGKWTLFLGRQDLATKIVQVEVKEGETTEIEVLVQKK